MLTNISLRGIIFWKMSLESTVIVNLAVNVPSGPISIGIGNKARGDIQICYFFHFF